MKINIYSIPDSKKWFVFRKDDEWILLNWEEIPEGRIAADIPEDRNPYGVLLANDREEAVKSSLKMALAAQRMEAGGSA